MKVRDNSSQEINRALVLMREEYLRGDNSASSSASSGSGILLASWPIRPKGQLNSYTYTGGFYEHASGSDDFDPAAVNWGSANASYAAHVYFVAASGATDTEITVTGTSITDAGVRTASDSEVVRLSNGGEGFYAETGKKFMGTVQIQKTAGTNRLCNYGWCKYWDNGNEDFVVHGVEALWGAAKNDAGFDVVAFHHKASGWTYNAGAEADPPELIRMSDVHVTETELAQDEPGAFKRVPLGVKVAGSKSEGVIFAVYSGTTNALDYGNIQMWYKG